jgi:hypothetical protein
MFGKLGLMLFRTSQLYWSHVMALGGIAVVAVLPISKNGDTYGTNGSHQ